MIVADLMTSKPVTVSTSDTLEQAQQRMETGRFRQLPVVEEGKLIGIITDRDLRQHAGQLKHIRVDAVMSAHPFSAHPSTPIEVAAHMLATNKVGSLPVIENAKLVGIITATDLLCAVEAILGSPGKCTVRIDLDVAGSGGYRGAQLDSHYLPGPNLWHLHPESHRTRDSISPSRDGQRSAGIRRTAEVWL